MADSIFGISEQAMKVCEDRAVTLTNNLVNASTPHYKARDIDFHKALEDANQATSLLETNSMHLEADGRVGGEKLLYRVPMQMSMDGNTVDDEMERKNFIENALRYQVNLTFVQNKTDELMKAIKGD